jgi:hypothetical protein
MVYNGAQAGTVPAIIRLERGARNGRISMRGLFTAAALGLCLGLAACDYDRDDYNQANAGYNAEGVEYNGTAGGGYNTTTTTTTASSWPEDARIVVEQGVTYRIDPGGARIRLGPNDSRILVEEGVTYRVDPDGTRVRIDPDGAVIRVDADGPAVEVNTQ